MNDPYDPYAVNSEPDALRDRPLPPGIAPPVLLWFRIYSGFLAFIYMLLFVSGIVLVVLGAGGGFDGDSPEEALIMGLVYGGMGGVLMALYGVGVLLPRRGWTWIYAIVLLALSMTSLCCLPFAIPLLIYWIKPECKEWFQPE